MRQSKLETMKFEAKLVPLVLSGKKTITWRLWDDKNIQKGDRVILIARPELKPFAEALVVSAEEKPMGELTKEDKTGHEEFVSDKEMYGTYSSYYKRTVDETSPVKVIKFVLLK